MKIPSLIPDSNLLEQIEGVEAGLRKIQKIGRVGQYGFLFTAILQLVFGLFTPGVLEIPPPGSAVGRAFTAIRIGSLLVLPLFLLLFTWSKFWLRQSREPFRYTCSIEPIGPLPHSPKVRQIGWLAEDLAELLSQRVERIRFVKSQPGNSPAQKDESHIDIGGTYVVRARDDEGKYLALEIMPNVGIGSGYARKLAYPVSYPPDPVSTPLELQKSEGEDGEIELKHSEYKALLERVYSSVATEIYQQIQTDVAGKIELMPTRFLRAQALFHEAEDYARSNTLHGYAEAGRLYDKSARLFDPCLGPLPVSLFRRFFARLTRLRVSLARRAMAWFSPMHLGFARRDIMCARALIGYVNMLQYGRILASLSGLKVNSAFEAQSMAEDALERLGGLPSDAPGCREALFDAHVSLALVCYYLGKRDDAERELATARSLDPTRDRDIHFQMARSELAPREKQAFRHLVNLAPRLETAQWSVAFQAERQWRSRPAFEKSLAGIPLIEYQRVIDINPGNVGAWANRGYLNWLLEECDDAKGCLRAGRDYKQIKQETAVAELDYGLARIAAEQGDLQEAYCRQETAVSDLIAPSGSHLGDFRGYYFMMMGEAVLNRFERYRQNVEKHLASAASTKDLPPRVLNTVYSFVLNDYGECCRWYWERTADRRHRRWAEEAFELAELLDSENPLAQNNLRELRVLHLNEAQLEREIAADHARIDAAQKEKGSATARVSVVAAEALIAVDRASVDRVQQGSTEKLGGSFLGRTHSGADPSSDPLDETIGAARKSIQQALDNARKQTKEAKVYDQKICEMYPHWTLGILREAETNAYAAFVERLAAQQEEKAIAQSKSPGDRLLAEDRKREYEKIATSLEAEVKDHIQALVPHRWLWTEGEFNWKAIRDRDPLNERRWEKQFNDIHTGALATYVKTLTLSTSGRPKAALLLDHINRTFAFEDVPLLRRLRDLSTKGAQITHTEYDLKIRRVLERWRADDPYSFGLLSWIAESPFTDYEKVKIFIDAARRPDLSGSLYEWLGTVQLLGIARRTKRKRELLDPITERMHRLPDLVKVEGPPPDPLEGDAPGKTLAELALVRALDELDKIHFEEIEGNGINEDEVDRMRENVEQIQVNLDDALDCSPSLLNQAIRNIGDETFHAREQQLNNLLERYREIEEQCREGARIALTRAVTASRDPETLWNVCEYLTTFGLFELAQEAATTAAEIDAICSEIAPDGEELKQAARMLLRAHPAEYATRFKQFLELYRRPAARSRPALTYTLRRCALLAMLEKLDAGDEPLLELKKSNKRWRAAIAAELGNLAGDDMEGETRQRFLTGRAAFGKWLTAEQRLYAGDSEEIVDCRMAEMTLKENDRRDFQGRASIVPGATTQDVLPVVTPLALEVATDLLAVEDSPRIKALFLQMRERVREDTGVTIPGVRVRDNPEMPKDQYLIMINEIPLVMGTAHRDKVFIRSGNGNPSPLSWPYSSAAEGSRSSFPPEGEWREPEKTRNGRRRERTRVLDPLEYLTAHVEFMIRLNVVKFFGLQEADTMLGEWLETSLPAEAAQHIVAVREDYRLLRRTTSQLLGLLEDRVPLTQPERLAAGLRATSGIADRVECRRLLRETLREQLWGNEDEYACFRLSDSIETMLKANSLRGERFSVSPENLSEFFGAVRTELSENGRPPALVTSEERLRYFVRYLIRAEWPDVPVLASFELLPPRAYDSLPIISLE